MVRWVGVLCGVCLMAAAGCGGGASNAPKLAPVSGTVTVDGAGVGGLVVTFEPQVDPRAKTSVVGQPSSGVTDASGTYELTSPSGVKGAPIGRCMVRVVAAGGEGGGAADPDATANAPSVTIPESYNTASTLSYEVKPGPNRFDIEIKTK